jgi:hypothetical protein
MIQTKLKSAWPNKICVSLLNWLWLKSLWVATGGWMYRYNMIMYAGSSMTNKTLNREFKYWQILWVWQFNVWLSWTSWICNGYQNVTGNAGWRRAAIRLPSWYNALVSTLRNQPVTRQQAGLRRSCIGGGCVKVCATCPSRCCNCNKEQT